MGLLQTMKFKGGYTFKRFEGEAEPVLTEIAVPGEVLVSRLAGDATFDAAVQTGTQIKAGQPLLTHPDLDTVVPSPVNGTVTEITGTAVTIKAESTSSISQPPDHTRAPWHLEPAELFTRLAASGGALLLGDTRRTAESMAGISHIVVNAIHNGPVDRSWKPSIAGGSLDFSNGLRTIKALCPDAAVTVAVNRRNADFFRVPEITDHADITVLSDRYPQEHPELLARDAAGTALVTATGEYDPSILILSFFDVFQAGEIMTMGRPLVDRIVMVAGPGVSRPGWYRIRIGTPFSHIKRELMKDDEEGPWRIIHGDCFTGMGVEHPAETHVTSATREIHVIREESDRTLFRFMRPGLNYDSYPVSTVADILPIVKKRLDSGVHGGRRPCVQCNYCDEVCPAGIYPHIIWKHVNAGITEDSFRYRPQDCIGCGLCNYVCPSRIWIAEAVTEAKRAYYTARSGNETAD